MMEEVEQEPVNTKRIKAIDKTAVHRICSGQVVLTLATAVKELVENSLDAGATCIDIRLRNYGANAIEVIDNGSGVEECNFQALTLKHYTSKLKEFSDLMDVTTFGFRGEALSSLCALSNLTIITCHRSTSVGSKLQFDHDGKLMSVTPAARQVGTTVLVENLFLTLPVRHKEFQRNIKKEFNKMVHGLTAYCLMIIDVKITCSNQTESNKRSSVLKVSGNSSVHENIVDIFGTKQLKSLVEFKQTSPSEDTCSDFGVPASIPANNPFISVSGFVSSAVHGEGRSTPDRQFYYVNRRPCDPSKIMRLVNEVYHMYNRNQFPFVVLNLQMNSDCADVNVTPDKRQVLLHHERLLLATIKASLTGMYESHLEIITDKSPVIGVQLSMLPLPAVQKNPQIQNQSSPGLSLANLKRGHNSVCSIMEKESTENGLKKQKKLLEFITRKQSDEADTADLPTSTFDKLLQAEDCSNILKERINDVNCNTNLSSTVETDSKRTPFAASDNDSVKLIKFEDNCKTKPRIISTKSESIENRLSCFTRLSRSRSESFVSASLVEKIQPVVKAANKTVCRGSTSNTHAWYEADKEDLDEHIKNCDENHIEDSGQLRIPVLHKQDTSIVSHVDVAVPVLKKSVTLQFSMFQMKSSLQHYWQRSEKESVRCRVFRAKISPSDNQVAEAELRKEIKQDMFQKMEVIGQFNLGFIICRYAQDLFIVDQHATDEKYNFEKLQKSTVLQGQKLIQPVSLELTATNESILLDNLEIFRKNGFDFRIDLEAAVQQRALLTCIPVSRNWSFSKEDIEEMIFMLSDSPGVICRPSRVRAMFASRACRSSVMIGTVLNKLEMKRLITHMGEIDQPWSCPHGRPTIRHLFNLDMLS